MAGYAALVCWKRERTWRFKQPFADRSTRKIALFVVLVYAVAFVLPMGKDNSFGFFAYAISFRRTFALYPTMS